VGEFTSQLARLRVAAATGRLPPDLGFWAVAELEAVAPTAERVDARNRLLRQAAARLSGSRWAKASRLARELEASGSRIGERSVDDGVRELVARALEADPAAPRSVRQIFRLLGAV
jgi:hypothetical protein